MGRSRHFLYLFSITLEKQYWKSKLKNCGLDEHQGNRGGLFIQREAFYVCNEGAEKAVKVEKCN